MNSVRVNLLPPELAQRQRRNRIITSTSVGVFLFLAALGGLYAMKLADVNRARADRDLAQAEVVALQGRVAELQPYRVLGDELDRKNELLAVAMADEISWARVLNDLAVTFPANSSLRTLNAATAKPEEAVPTAAGEEPEEAPSKPVATIEFSGYSIEEYAPGVETALIEFDGVRSFFDTFLTTAAAETVGDDEVTAYTSIVQLNDQAYTRRYEHGLPPEAGR